MPRPRVCAAIRSRDELHHFMEPLEGENAELRREIAGLRREIATLKGQEGKPRIPLTRELDGAGVWQLRVARRSVTPA